MNKLCHLIFYGLLLLNIQTYTVNGYYTHTLRHHNGLLEQGTNTTESINPGIRVPYYFNNNYYLYRSPNYNLYDVQHQVIIAFTLIKNDGSYGYVVAAT